MHRISATCIPDSITEAADNSDSPSTAMHAISMPSATSSEPRPETSGDPIRQALVCLESAGSRLKRGEAEQADEVLNLLRAATDHLRQALDR